MHIDWSGMGEVFGIGLAAGVAVVVLFSLGIAALDRRTGAPGSDRAAAPATAVAGLCFLACAALVGYGIYLVVAR